MFNAIINTGSLVGMAFMVSDAVKAGQKAASSTFVEIGAGLGKDGVTGDFGGAMPAIAIWNAQGKRLGQYMPNGETIPSGTSGSVTVDQNQGYRGQPEYLQLTTVNDDAICITYVTVAGNGVNWNWMGDIGYTCGGDWYPSTAKFGSDNFQPKCAWIDANHSDGLRFIALSMHMPDFNGNSALVKELNAHPENLCHSKARFMQWGQLPANPGQNSVPPMFDPPLEYNEDGSDKDFKALFKPGWADKRDAPSTTNTTGQMNGSIDRPGHVVISDYKAHNAAEVCESKTSRGPSFVSTQDGTYCDMSTKTSYPLCSTGTNNRCFDVESKQLLGKPRHHPRDLHTREVHKRYASHERWTPSD